MTPAITWQADIKRNPETDKLVICWRDREHLQRFVEQFEGKRVLVTVEEYSKSRSLNQNAYVHVIFGLISEATGFEPFEVKELCKAMFLYTVDRKGRVHVRGTSKLTKRQMSEFIEQVCRWAAIWLDICIPPAESVPEAWAA